MMIYTWYIWYIDDVYIYDVTPITTTKKAMQRGILENTTDN